MKNNTALNLPEEWGGVVYLPCANELASVYLGSSLVSPRAHPEMKAHVEKMLHQFEEHMTVRYEQNTADELNIVVPGYELLKGNRCYEMTEEELSKIAGGEVLGLMTIGSMLGSIGFSMGMGLGFTATTVGMTATAGLLAAHTVTYVAVTTSLATTLAGAAVLSLSASSGKIG